MPTRTASTTPNAHPNRPIPFTPRRAWLALAGALAMLALLATGATKLWTHTSNTPTFLGRFAPDFFALLIAYHILLTAWVGLCGALAYGAATGRLGWLDQARSRLVERPLLLWGTLAGLWGLALAYLGLTAYRGAVYPAVRAAPVVTLAYTMAFVPWAAIAGRLRRGLSFHNLTAGAILACAAVLLLYQLVGAAKLWLHTSERPTILNRYSPEYAIFLAAYHLMMAVWAGLTLGTAIHLHRQRLGALITRFQRFAAHPLRLWSTVTGLCLLALLYWWLLAPRVPAGARSRPLVTPIFAALLLAGGTAYLRLREQHSRAKTLAVIGLLAGMLTALAVTGAGAAALQPPIVSSRTAAALFAATGLMALVWAALLAALVTLIARGQLTRFEAALRRYAARKPAFWGAIAGLWGATALLAHLGVRANVSPPAMLALVFSPSALRWLLFALIGCAGGFAMPEQPTNTTSGSPAARMLGRAAYLLRRDGAALALFAEITLVFTYPLFVELGSLLPTHNTFDPYAIVWRNWWLARAIFASHDPAFASPILRPSTSLLFYPRGLDLTFADRPWVYMVTHVPLAALFGNVVAYNINSLLALWAGSYFAYLLILYLTGNRLASWVGGAVFTFWPAHIWMFFSTPHAGHTELLPLFMLAFIHALRTCRAGDTLLASGALALTAYYSVKVTLLAVAAGGLYALWWLARERRWRDARLWKALALFAVTTTLLIAPILLPFAANRGYVGYAVEKYDISGSTRRTNLGTFVIPFRNSIPTLPSQIYTHVADILDLRLDAPGLDEYPANYVGLIGLGLIALGWVDIGRRQREHFVWPVMAAAFTVLSLGATLAVGRHVVRWLPMPLRLITSFFLVRALHSPERFFLIANLAAAVVIAFGLIALARRSQALGQTARTAIVGGVAALLLVVYAPPPLTGLPAEISPFYEHVARDGETYAIIDLPVGGQYTKLPRYYMYLQTTHHKPILDGKVARMPADAYRFVESDPLLRAWNEGHPLDCQRLDYSAALDRLRALNFRYVIVHKVDWGPTRCPESYDPQFWQSYFVAADPAYEDDLIVVYDLRALDASNACTKAHARP